MAPQVIVVHLYGPNGEPVTTQIGVILDDAIGNSEIHFIKDFPIKWREKPEETWKIITKVFRETL